MVTGFAMMFYSTKYAARRITLGLVATVTYMALLLILRPYVQRELNWLSAIGSQFALGFSMLVVLYISMFNDIKANNNLPDAKEIMKFDSTSDVRAKERRRQPLPSATDVLWCGLLCSDCGMDDRAGVPLLAHVDHHDHV
jgi:hypothetical protein